MDVEEIERALGVASFKRYSPATVGSHRIVSLLAATALAVFTGGCRSSPRAARTGTEVPPSPPSVSQAAATSQLVTHRFSDNWGNASGCTPRGEQLSLEATLVVRPFGKGTDGALLKTDTDEWVVSYRAKGALLDLRGKRVWARGRACDKQGEAVFGKHFDLTTLTEARR